jgi:hypothetical protein
MGLYEKREKRIESRIAEYINKNVDLSTDWIGKEELDNWESLTDNQCYKEFQDLMFESLGCINLEGDILVAKYIAACLLVKFYESSPSWDLVNEAVDNQSKPDKLRELIFKWVTQIDKCFENPKSARNKKALRNVESALNKLLLDMSLPELQEAYDDSVKMAELYKNDEVSSHYWVGMRVYLDRIITDRRAING